MTQKKKRNWKAVRNKKKLNKKMTAEGIKDKYGLTDSMIRKYLPKPEPGINRQGREILYWRDRDIIAAIETNEKLKAELKRIADRREKAERKRKDAVNFLTQFSPEDLINAGAELDRRFILHVGPTNSGKTYDALQALKACDTGVYLGPLRLLALEVCETLNFDGIPCNLLTGEEHVDIPFAYKTASTIELADYSRHYDVCVIDEAQMLTEPERGAGWIKAITMMQADEVHICLAPEALPVIENMIRQMDSPYEIHRHERLVPLKFSGFFDDISNVEQGDCLIAFSRKKVLQISALLEQKGIQASVIYGALPPQSRREEVRRFSERETKVVVATDAIGMGVSLPIRRVIFVDTEKYDGKTTRKLKTQEIKQIGGRAGRYMKYDLGEVLTMYDTDLIAEGLEAETPAIEKLMIAFPKEALSYDHPLSEMLKIWDELPEEDLFERENMKEAEYLLSYIAHIPSHVTKEQVYDLITCPVDTKNQDLVTYWLECVNSIFYEEPLPRPYFRENSLESCELKYHAYDVYHQLLRRVGTEDDCMAEKIRLSDKINDFLKDEKSGFLRKCKRCGKEIPIYGRFNLCEDCKNREREKRVFTKNHK